MNSRQMKQMMKKMGMQQTEIAAIEVIIKTPDGELVILCKLTINLPDYSERDQLIQELEAKEYIFDVSKWKWQDPHPGFKWSK